MGENSFSALGNRYCSGWVPQKVSPLIRLARTKRSLPV
jgi:hypothetical protein